MTALYVVVATVAIIGIAIVIRLRRVLRRDYNLLNGPLPALTPTLRYRVGGGQDAIAVALALDRAGFRTIERFVRGETILQITLHTRSLEEREAIRSVIVNAPTLDGSEYHPDPPIVVFVDEEISTGPSHVDDGRP